MLICMLVVVSVLLVLAYAPSELLQGMELDLVGY
jgi:hypothetical protein